MFVKTNTSGNNQSRIRKEKKTVKDKDRKLLTLIIGINPRMSRFLYLVTFIFMDESCGY